MTSLPFEQLFTLPAFEGLRAVRIQATLTPSLSLKERIALVQRTDANAASYDLVACETLDSLVPENAPADSVLFYRMCLSATLLSELPEWAKLITLGRGRFIRRLKANEFRDIRSLFRQAKLLDDPPKEADIEWWDSVQAEVRKENDQRKLKQGRAAEKLSLDHEADELKKVGISQSPRWMAIEDNTVGYDVLSYVKGPFGPVNRLIEVKSTVASSLRFYVTRNEWGTATKYGEAYLFHIWDMRQTPPALYKRSVDQVAPHIPNDQKKGKWTVAEIPLGI